MNVSDELFNASMSAMYHCRRASFLAWLTRVLSFLTIALGTGSFAALSAQMPEAAKWAGVLVALIGTAVIVFMPETGAADHRRWYAMWLDVVREMKLTEKPTLAQRARWSAVKLETERDYPGELRALAHDCYNKTAASYGMAHDIYHVRWFMIPFLQVFGMEGWFPRAAERYHELAAAAVE